MWLAQQVEAEGIDFFTGFAGQDVLMDGARVLGVRTGDRGIGKHGDQKPTFEPGVDILAKVTIFCDGVRGNLTKELLRRLQLGKGRQPRAVRARHEGAVGSAGGSDRGRAPSSTRWAIRCARRSSAAGSSTPCPDGQLSVGFVDGPRLQGSALRPAHGVQPLQAAPVRCARCSKAGQMVRYGAKALPEGGWNTIPQPYMDGGLIAGDAGGFLNSMRLKGIHLAMRTGMLAAESAFDAIRAGDTSAASLKRYQDKIDASPVRAELYPVRNVHQAFGYGLLAGMAVSGLTLVTRGHVPRTVRAIPVTSGCRRSARYYGTPVERMEPSNATPIDRKLTFDKVTNVHYSGTAHDEDGRQEVHARAGAFLDLPHGWLRQRRRRVESHRLGVAARGLRPRPQHRARGQPDVRTRRPRKAVAFLRDVVLREPAGVAYWA